MSSNNLFDKILKEGRLGTLTARPQRITGGYMHKMYKLETTTGTYALKLLNPSIMKRPDAFLNYQRAEELEEVLQDNNIPIVPALKINGCKMQCFDNQFYYIFQWVEGKTLSWHEIKDKHCKIVGGLLAKIHKIKEIEMPFTSKKINVDWDTYIRLANTRCPEIAEEYDIHFIFSDTIPNINFYTIPQVDIFAVDSNGGLIGTIGQPTDFDSNAPICYIDKKRVCYLIAPNGATFLRNVANWKTDLHPCHDVVFYSSKSVAESELEFFDINKIDISLEK